MKEKIQDLIKKYEKKGNFLYTSPDERVINEAEDRLGVKLPEDFKWFLHKYGYGGIGGRNILGIGYNNVCMFEKVTMDYRKYGLNKNYVAIENCDEWLYCIDINNGKILMWSMDGFEQPAYDNFLNYFLDQLNDAIENL
jgi:hypothetical protein